VVDSFGVTGNPSALSPEIRERVELAVLSAAQ